MKLIDTIIKEVFNTDNYQSQKLNKGLNNNNYLITINNNKYVLRIPSEINNQHFNRNSELQAIKLCKDLDTKLIYFNVGNGIKINQYLTNCLDFSEYRNDNSIKLVALALKQLHSKPCIDSNFNPIDKLYYYKNKVKNNYFINFDDYKFIINNINNLNSHQCLCHNDLVSGNLLFKDNQCYIIDYEYASNNDPLFDVMSFISENNLNKHERDIFYHYYFDDNIPLNTLDLWENFHNLLWYYWALMMYEQENNQIYYEIAIEKYQNLIKKVRY